LKISGGEIYNRPEKPIPKKIIGSNPQIFLMYPYLLEQMEVVLNDKIKIYVVIHKNVIIYNNQ